MDQLSGNSHPFDTLRKNEVHGLHDMMSNPEDDLENFVTSSSTIQNASSWNSIEIRDGDQKIEDETKGDENKLDQPNEVIFEDRSEAYKIGEEEANAFLYQQKQEKIMRYRQQEKGESQFPFPPLTSFISTLQSTPMSGLDPPHIVADHAIKKLLNPIDVMQQPPQSFPYYNVQSSTQSNNGNNHIEDISGEYKPDLQTNHMNVSSSSTSLPLGIFRRDLMTTTAPPSISIGMPSSISQGSNIKPSDNFPNQGDFSDPLMIGVTVPIPINEDYQEESPTDQPPSPSNSENELEFEHTQRNIVYRQDRKGKDPLPKSSGGIKKKRICARWTEEENKRLVDAYVRFEGKNWSQIAKAVGNKTSDQCNQHWHRVLNPNISKKQWSPEEDALLFQRVLQFGESSWKRVSEGFHGRTDLQCRHRWTQCKKSGEVPFAISQALMVDSGVKPNDMQNPFLMPNILAQIPTNPLPPPILPYPTPSSSAVLSSSFDAPAQNSRSESKAKDRQNDSSKVKASNEMTFVDETKTFSEPRPPKQHNNNMETHPDFQNSYLFPQLPMGFGGLNSNIYMPQVYPVDMNSQNRLMQHGHQYLTYPLPSQPNEQQQQQQGYEMPSSAFIPINEASQFNNNASNPYPVYPMLDPNFYSSTNTTSNSQNAPSNPSPPSQQVQIFYTNNTNNDSQPSFYLIQNQNGGLDQLNYPAPEIQNSKLPPSFQQPSGSMQSFVDNPFMQPHSHSINFHSNPMTYFYPVQQTENEFHQTSAFKPINEHQSAEK